MNILLRNILILFMILASITKGYGQTYKYKVKWNIKRSSGSNEITFYLNTGDTYPYNTTYAYAISSAGSNSFYYTLNNSSVSIMDGVAVSNSPLRLSQSVRESSGVFTQRNGSLLTGPESGYWYSTFGYPLSGNNVSLTDPFEFYYLYTLKDLNNYDALNTDLKACKTFYLSVGNVGEGGSMTFALEYFHSGTGVWKELLGYERRNALSIPIQLSQIPGLQLDQNFQLRARYSPTGSRATDYSDILTYKFISCPPAIIGDPEPKSPICYNSDTGKIIMHFDNDLATNEYFSMSLTPVVNGFELPPSNKTVVQSEFTDRTIVWDNLRAGTYNLKYQTFKTGNPNPSSIVEKNNIIIIDKEPLSFQLFKTDAQCNNQNGALRIEVFGGTSPYYYTINSGTEVKLTDETKNINISGGTYFIRVRDENNCIDLDANDNI